MTAKLSMTTIFRIIQIVLLGLVIGVALSRSYFSKILPHNDITKDVEVITEKIEAVSKLVVVEGVFSEIYSYEDAYRMFYDYISFEKKAILTVKAKAALSIDLTKMDYELDEVNKKILLKRIPEPEMMIEPEIRYFDLQESTFNEFSIEELNAMNKDAVEQMRQMVKDSNLFEVAKAETIEAIKDVELLSKYLGWEVIDQTGAERLQSIDDVRIINPERLK